MRPSLAVLALAVLACSDATSPDAASMDPALLRGEAAVYVLSSVEGQRAEPIVTFDHTCSGTWRQHTIRDTIEFLGGNRVRRAFRLDQLTDGAGINSSYLTASGTWTARGGARLMVTLNPENYNGTPYDMALRVRDGSSLGMESGLGGSCPGSPNDGYAAEFVFTRR